MAGSIFFSGSFSLSSSSLSPLSLLHLTPATPGRGSVAGWGRGRRRGKVERCRRFFLFLYFFNFWMQIFFKKNSLKLFRICDTKLFHPKFFIFDVKVFSSFFISKFSLSIFSLQIFFKLSPTFSLENFSKKFYHKKTKKVTINVKKKTVRRSTVWRAPMVACKLA